MSTPDYGSLETNVTNDDITPSTLSLFANALLNYLEHRIHESNHPIIDDNDYTNNPLLPKETTDVVIKTKIDDTNNDECPICFDKLGDRPYVNLRCHGETIHRFHEDCITMTLNGLMSSTTDPTFSCPMCRYNHIYENISTTSKNHTMLFKEYWFKTSVDVVSRIESIILLIITFIYTYYAYHIMINKYTEQYPNNNQFISSISGGLIIQYFIVCIIVLVKYISTGIYRQIFNNTNTKNIEWYNFPLIPSVLILLFYTIYFTLNLYIYSNNKHITLFIVYSSPLLFFAGIFISYLIINNVFFKNINRCDRYLSKCQIITNIIMKKFREKKKKEFCSSFRIWNDRQDFIVQITPD